MQKKQNDGTTIKNNQLKIPKYMNTFLIIFRSDVLFSSDPLKAYLQPTQYLLVTFQYSTPIYQGTGVIQNKRVQLFVLIRKYIFLLTLHSIRNKKSYTLSNQIYWISAPKGFGHLDCPLDLVIFQSIVKTDSIDSCYSNFFRFMVFQLFGIYGIAPFQVDDSLFK